MSFIGINIMGNCFYFLNYGPDYDYFLMSFGTIGYSLIDLGQYINFKGISNLEIIYESIKFN